MTRKGWILFITISIFWGIPYLFIKIAVKELDPVVVVFGRAVIAAAALLPIMLQRKMFSQLKGHWPVLITFALIHMVGSFLLIAYGEQHISSSLTSLIIAANPLIVAVIAGLGFAKSERVNGSRLVGLLIGMFGLVVLLGFDLGGDGQLWLGAAFVFLAAAGYAIGALMLNHTGLSQVPRLAVAGIECSVTTIVLLPISLMRLPSHVPSLNVFVSLLVLGLICTAAALLVFFALIAEVGASRGTVITYINPAISVLLGVIFLSEELKVSTVVGFLLIILGSWISTGGTLPRFRSRRQLAGETSEPEPSHVEA
jgi:drug/metabolite transporter (DMT)-like permease